MVPMLNPMVSETTLLFAISPAFAAVAMVLVALTATSLAVALRQYRPRPRVRTARRVAPARSSSPVAA
jgi:hypothetical protein